jgi:hypothetical protein
MPGDGEGGGVHGYLGHLLRGVHVSDVDLHVLAGARQQHAVMAEGDRSHLHTHWLINTDSGFLFPSASRHGGRQCCGSGSGVRDPVHF